MGRGVGRLPKYVHGYLDRHGRPRHYLRMHGRKKVPLPGMPFSTQFMDAYQAALEAAPPVVIGLKRSVPGTVAEAVARYLGSAAFVTFAVTTQAMRRAILQRFRDEHGDILEQITGSGELANEQADKLKQVIRDFKTQFK